MSLARVGRQLNYGRMRSFSTSCALFANPNVSPDFAALNPAKGEPAAKKPVKIALKAGETVSWCACGYSTLQPYCDGSHNRPGVNPNYLRPVKYTAPKDETILLCLCKLTKNRPFCDGSHRELAPGPIDAEHDIKMEMVTYWDSPVNDEHKSVAAKLGYRPDVKMPRPSTFVDDARNPEMPDNMPDFVRKKTW